MIPFGLMMKNINLREVDLSNTKGTVIGNMSGGENSSVHPSTVAQKQ